MLFQIIFVCAASLMVDFTFADGTCPGIPTDYPSQAAGCRYIPTTVVNGCQEYIFDCPQDCVLDYFSCPADSKCVYGAILGIECKCDNGEYNPAENTCGPAAPACGTNMVPAACANPCPTTCDGTPSAPCDKPCQAGCECADGFVFNGNNTCIALSECPVIDPCDSNSACADGLVCQSVDVPCTTTPCLRQHECVCPPQTETNAPLDPGCAWVSHTLPNGCDDFKVECANSESEGSSSSACRHGHGKRSKHGSSSKSGRHGRGGRIGKGGRFGSHGKNFFSKFNRSKDSLKSEESSSKSGRRGFKGFGRSSRNIFNKGHNSHSTAESASANSKRGLGGKHGKFGKGIRNFFG